MSPDRWKNISDLYAAALERPSADRAEFVAGMCGDDEALRQEVESLLACHHEAQHTLTSPATEIMARAIAEEAGSLVGTQLGAYRIDASLGAGGMGEVYRATDTRLHRAVAMKILPSHLRSDADWRARFEREAQAVAALRHPHVCVLHDIGHVEGIDFLVMELLDGETMADRLARGPLPVVEALRYGIQIADALSATHRHGIIHRDLKPGNIMLTEAGAKLLDFGLAKVDSAHNVPGEAFLGAGGHTSAAGTLPYMTPEQLDRKEVDQRTDIFTFGALLYEMVTARKAFDAPDPKGVASAIRANRPPRLPHAVTAVAPGLPTVIDRCLRTSPDERWPDAAALGEALRRVADAAAREPRRINRAGVVLMALTLVAVGLMLWSGRQSGRDSTDSIASPALTVGRAHSLTAAEEIEMDPSLSPRGDLVAYAAGRGTEFRIVVRSLSSNRVVEGPPISKTAQLQPRWSPDGSQLLYITGDGVYVWSQSSGSSARIASASDVRGNYSFHGPAGDVITGAAWSPDGREIAVAFGGAVFAVSIETGRRRHLVTGPDELHWCEWSPRGTWLACTEGNAHLEFSGAYFSNTAPSAIVLVPTAGGPLVEVEPKTTMNQSPVWSPDGRRLYFVSNRQGTSDVYAVDITEKGPRGDPVRLTTGLGAYSITMAPDRKTLAYTVVASRANIWSLPVPTGSKPVDLAAARQVTSGNQVIESMHVTADGKWLVYDSNLHGNSEIFRIAVDGGTPTRLTTDPSDDFAPNVSPDGRWLAFHSWRTKSRDVFVQPFDGGPVQQVTGTDGQESYPKWLPDGSLAFVDQAIDQGVIRGVFLTRRQADGTWSDPQRLLAGAWGPAVFKDGRLIYSRDGRVETLRPGDPEPVVLYRSGPGLPLPGYIEVDRESRYFTKSFDSAGRASLWSFPLTGGRPTQLVRFDDPVRPSSRFDFTVSNGRFFFTIDDRRSNIWIADVKER